MADDITRIVALGASNLTRGLQTVVSTARNAWGPNVEVLGALGHGRSYGVTSRFVIRTLPGILHSGLWPTLSSLPPARTRGLVTDVGNDIAYGFPAPRILEWVEEAVDRLQRFTADVVITDLPLTSIRRLSARRFLLFRSIVFPRCRLSLAEIVDTAERVNEGLESVASARALHFVRLRPEWYSVDPIHIRPAFWRPAWQHILGCEPADYPLVAGPPAPVPSGAGWHGGWRDGLRLYFLPPERQSLLGRERVTPQAGVVLPRGGKVWLF
jgi:hypothetical protein